jgi:hypothetical protein
MEQRAVISFLAFKGLKSLKSLKGLKAKKIETKLAIVYGDETLQISAMKHGEGVSCGGEQNSEMTDDRKGPSNLI